MTAIPVEAIVFEIQMRHEEIEFTVVIVISGIGTHTGFWLAVLAKSHACLECDLLERAISLVEVKKIFHRVIRNENVSPSIPIKIKSNHAQATALPVTNFCTSANVVKNAVMIGMIQ